MADIAVPLVSVGLVTYNRADILPQAINSVLKQSFTNFELLIADDNSSDHTLDVIRPYLTDRRIRYIRREGVGMTQNFVQTLRDARGEYFIWLCDDDSFSEHYIEVCLNFLSKNPDYSLACGITRFVKEDKLIDRLEELALEQNSTTERVVQYFINVNSNVILYGLMRRRDALRFIYPDTFCADLLWSCQVVFFGKIKTLADVGFHYSLNGISETTSSLRDYYKSTRGIKKNPYAILRSELIRLIFSKSTVFVTLKVPQKILLSARLWFILRKRFLMPSYEAKIRGSLRVRTRLKALFE